MLNYIRGQWYEEGSEERKRNFRMEIRDKVSGVVKLTQQGKEDEKIPVEIDLKDKTITSTEPRENKEQDPKLFMEAIDAVDTGMLTFFIFQPDVSFLRYGQGSFIQAKLRSTDDEDENSNGKGVVESSIVLYRVSENMPKNTGKGAEKKLKYKKEPNE